MLVINKSSQKKLEIQANYSEVHLIRKALSLYRLRMQTDHGMQCEEEMMIGELLHELKNPIVENLIEARKER